MPATSIDTMPVIYPGLHYRDAEAAMEWVARAFGFVKRASYPGPSGTIMHAEMSYGPGVIMLGSAKPEKGWVSPQDLPAVNQTIYVVVDDPDAHYARAKAAGAEIVEHLSPRRRLEVLGRAGRRDGGKVQGREWRRARVARAARAPSGGAFERAEETGATSAPESGAWVVLSGPETRMRVTGDGEAAEIEVLSDGARASVPPEPARS